MLHFQAGEKAYGIKISDILITMGAIMLLLTT